jgi:GGDEF domain-containing protein
MSTLELFIWSAMSGAALLLTCTAAAAALRALTMAAWRGLALIGLISSSAVLMSGLPEFLLGITDAHTLLPLKITIGPLSGALCLVYLGSWLGITAEERGAQRWVTFGSICSWLGGLVVLALWYNSSDFSASQLLAASGAVNMVPALVAVGLTVRNMVLGDALARWMLIACVSLATMVLGLYAKGIGLPAPIWVWMLVAIAAMLYLLMAVGLTLARYQSERRLERIAQGNTATDPITGLSVGSVLLTKVDDAMWRSARLGRDTVMMAIWVNNLYELNESGGNETVQEIRQRLTATVRRAVGFKDVVGLAQARCYVVAISAVKDPAYIDKITTKVLTMLPRPMRVGYMVGEALVYTPQIGVGIVHILTAAHGEPLQAIDQAVRLAQQAVHMPDRLLKIERTEQIRASA